MGVRSSIQGGVDTAFKKLAELTVDAKFSTKEVIAFDFGAGEVVAKNVSSITLKGFVFYAKNNMYVASTLNVPVRSLTLLVKTEGREYNYYTQVEITGKIYKPSLISSDEFITQFELKEI
jgi:hypothetical protein